MTQKSDHGIIIRFHYPENDPRIPWRLDFFRSMVLPRLLKQTNMDFEMWLWCNECHADMLQKIHPLINTFSSKTFNPGLNDHINKKEMPGYTKGLPKFSIQSRIDSDDLVTPDYIDRIKYEIKKVRVKQPLLVSFQPYKLDIWTLQQYEMNTRYHSQQCSMFLSLYQPDLSPKNYIYIYELNHIRAWQKVPSVVTIPEGYCHLVIHGDNMLTNIKPNDKELHVMK